MCMRMSASDCGIWNPALTKPLQGFFFFSASLWLRSALGAFACHRLSYDAPLVLWMTESCKIWLRSALRAFACHRLSYDAPLVLWMTESCKIWLRSALGAFACHRLSYDAPLVLPENAKQDTLAYGALKPMPLASTNRTGGHRDPPLQRRCGPSARTKGNRRSFFA